MKLTEEIKEFLDRKACHEGWYWITWSVFCFILGGAIGYCLA